MVFLRKQSGQDAAMRFPEHFQKNCSHAAGEPERAVFLGCGFVSAQLQGFANLRLCQILATTQKSSLRIGCIFSSNALLVTALLICFCAQTPAETVPLYKLDRAGQAERIASDLKMV